MLLTDSRYAFLYLVVTYCGLLIRVILPYIWLLHNVAYRSVLCFLVSGYYMMLFIDLCYTSLYLVVT